MESKWSLILGSILLIVPSACSVKELDNPKAEGISKEIVFTAEFVEGHTKTAFQSDETSIWWSPNDEISIFYGASEGNKFTSTNDIEVAKAEFRGTLNAFTGETETGDFNYFWAVYPYSAAVSCNGSSVVAYLSNQQIGKAGSFAPNTNITIAKNFGLALSFYNACAWFRFSVKKEGIKSVVFRGNNNEDIAGKFSVSMDSDGKPTQPVIVEGTKEITLSAPANETLEVGAMYYITLLPQVFENGFTVTFNTATQTGCRSINARATYLRSKYNTGRDFDKDIVYVDKAPDTDIIQFADEKIKEKLVAAFDKNGDGELSYDEAAAVKSIDGVFGSTKDFTSFDEFQYFTGVTEVSPSMFANWSNLSSITLHNKVTSIGNGAFFRCSELTNIVIPESVKKMGTGCFRECKNLSSVTMPLSLDELGGYAFYFCQNLLSIVIPNGVTCIDYYTFCSCYKLESVVIPSTVNLIGQQAFYDCKRLSNITIPNSVTKIEDNAFRGCYELATITIPNSVKEIGRAAFFDCRGITTISIPNGVTKIEESVFAGCSTLTTVTLPSTIKSIGQSAFNSCWRLETINLPEGITDISDIAFYDCESLTEVYLPATLKNLGDGAFYNCTRIKHIIAYAETPFTINDTSQGRTFPGKYYIYVLNGSVNKYKSAWEYYASRIRSINYLP